MNTIEMDQVKREVRKHYGQVAQSRAAGCDGSSSGCCGGSAATESQQLGYSIEDTDSVPEGANLGLGCGNPLAIASLRSGQTVLDLGSGAGFDCFLAATPRFFGSQIDTRADLLTTSSGNSRSSGRGARPFAGYDFFTSLKNVEGEAARTGAVVQLLCSGCIRHHYQCK
jgi:arsenite methyltransferase